MAGKKRSEIQASPHKVITAAAPAAKIVRRSATPGREYRQALCPVCGSSHGYKRVKNGDIDDPGPGELVNYWKWLAARERTLGHGDKQPFGTIQEIGKGKGHSMKIIGYFGPENDPDGYFPLVRSRLILTVRRWIARGWLKLSDLK
ncbi:MAG: hypothetical protein PHI12_06545 [Dehalococcoidales bacterium]|nr:hypothetical protein [Dehalococcoidales bacterium]